MPFYRFDFRFDGAEWQDLRSSGTERLQAITEALSARGWNLYLFWPSDSSEAYVVAEGAAPNEVAQVLADAVGGSIAGIGQVDVDLPDRPMLDAEKVRMVTVAAHRGPDGACEGCGAVEPPHLRGCTRERQEVEATVEARELVH